MIETEHIPRTIEAACGDCDWARSQEPGARPGSGRTYHAVRIAAARHAAERGHRVVGVVTRVTTWTPV